MANYAYQGPGPDLFNAATGGGLPSRLLYNRADQFGVLNGDGSKTYFSGTGLVWNQASGHFTAGTITGIVHYSAAGAFIDELSGLNVPMTDLDTLLHLPVTKPSASAFRDLLLGGADSLTGGGGIDFLSGGAGNDTIAGHAGNDFLSGQAGDDSLNGGAGIDSLFGGAGADILNGGADNDWANYTTSAEGVSVNLLTGIGTGGEAEGDRLHSIEALVGSAKADTLIGNNAANALYGKAGNDMLYGGNGNDVLRGGAGADLLDGGAGTDWANYLESKAGVTVDLMTGTGARGDAAGDVLVAIENLAGSDFYDLLTGNNGNNWFYGHGGDDTIHGRGGVDRADGGAGNDFITGGDGNDILIGGSGDDLIDGGIGRDVIYGGTGNDVIYGGPEPDVVVYDFAWDQITATYDATDFSFWIVAPDGTDHVFTALTIATTTGTYRFDIPTATWVHDPTMTGSDWLGL